MRLAPQEHDTTPGPESVGRAALATTRELKMRLGLGLFLVVFLVGVVGGWAVSAPISGAVVASGTLVVESKVKRVQHVHGGTVAQIHVRNGDVVHAGQVVVRLDDTQLRASLAIIVSQLAQLRGRKARLEATRDGLDTPQFPAGFSETSVETAKIAAGERRLHLALALSMTRRIAQLEERIGQLQREIEGIDAQRLAKARELSLIEDEEQRVADMRARKLIPVTRLLSIKRDVTRVAGELGALKAQIASRSGQVNEIRLQILALDDDARSSALEELREVSARIAELRERSVAAGDQLARVAIAAPRDGVVHELSVHTVGGVIKPAQQIMVIVPQDEALRVETPIARQDIDQVHPGQVAKLRFAAFSQRSTPEVEGRVLSISADIKTDARTGEARYGALIALEEAALTKLRGLTLVPGMPVDVFIETAPRTVMSYLMKPVTDNLKRAFREE